MAKKNLATPEKDFLLETIKELQGEKALPPMTPDTIDDFVTWLYDRVDLRSFERSKYDYKIKMFRQFIHSLSNKQIQRLITSREKKV